jgi:hypothetical protein
MGTLSLQYVAGLIAGEGTFCLGVMRVANRRGGARITPIFGIYMTDEDTIGQVADSLREHGLPVYYQERLKAGSKGNPRKHVGIHASGIKRVKRYCDTFVPLLTGQKRRAAELVQEFCDSRLATPRGGTRGNPPYTERQIQIVEELRTVNSVGNGRKNPVEILRGHTSDAPS